MKKEIIKNQRKIIANIKKRYEDVRDAAKKGPEVIDRIIRVILALLFLLYGVIIYCAIFQTLWLKILLSCVVVALLFFIFCYFHNEKKYKLLLDSVQEDIDSLCKESIKEEAEEYGLSGGELMFYLVAGRKESWWVTFLVQLISFLATMAAVYFIPGFNSEEHNFLIYFLIVSANYGISILASLIVNEICNRDWFFDFMKKAMLKDVSIINNDKENS